ncbi:hypothetical protein [Vibrio furnissii]|jgi:hypothetical protein|uniref:hypothetical protein n=1 Tax=Vibrio furnissii TaxID=29494 RepID=UPI000200CB82|nr:hypothetical protein [Vibrio furnissii]ADT87343.1 hypothetical protein vfu_A02204 [Vibrio furnissii NCTC 11218]
MKLVIKEYLASLNERDELDAILPDLLSQLGLTVFGKPIRGASERGVDVAAVGSLYGGVEKVYLFSIKAGDLTRATWNGNENQVLRPSLDEIIDSYIPHRLPPEHKGKPIVICPCFGGDVQTPVRDLFTGYIDSRTRTNKNIEFEEWNGDKLANLINDNFLHENFMPDDTRSLLRKSVSMIDEPDTSFRYFAYLVSILRDAADNAPPEKVLKILRQINICLWILYGWSRKEKNFESAYLSSEVALLNAWYIGNSYFSKSSKNSKLIQSVIFSIKNTYFKINYDFMTKIITPYVYEYGAISRGVCSSSTVDINLKLFDLLGRISILGIWLLWELEICQQSNVESKTNEQQALFVADCIINLINSNPILFSPLKDEQAIDITLAVLFLVSLSKVNQVKDWLEEMLLRVSVNLTSKGAYPCILHDYMDLLEHPKNDTAGYFEESTAGSILYSSIGCFSALFDFDDLYTKLSEIQTSHLSHCSIQLWYPDEESEKELYIGGRYHGFCLSDFDFELTKNELLSYIFSECRETQYFDNLSAIKYGLYPIVLMACRAYKIPVPPNFFLPFEKK